MNNNNDMGNMDMPMDMPMPHMDMMKMYFHGGYKEYVLFYEAHTESAGAMVGACFVVFLLAVLYEGFKFMRENLMKSMSKKPVMSVTPTADSPPQGNWSLSQEQIIKSKNVQTWQEAIFSASHLVQSLLHMVQIFISYCLMLVFMTFNIYLCLAVVFGFGVGYFLFGWRRAMAVDSTDHCQ